MIIGPSQRIISAKNRWNMHEMPCFTMEPLKKLISEKHTTANCSDICWCPPVSDEPTESGPLIRHREHRHYVLVHPVILCNQTV